MEVFRNRALRPDSTLDQNGFLHQVAHQVVTGRRFFREQWVIFGAHHGKLHALGNTLLEPGGSNQHLACQAVKALVDSSLVNQQWQHCLGI